MEAFFFGIPLIARAVAADWSRVDALLSLTLASVRAQRDGNYRVLLAAHDVPPCWAAVADDPRFSVLRADWPPAPPSPANDDGGAKKWLVKRAVRDAGGGLLMFLDADDWVDRDLVGACRATIGRDAAGGVVVDGLAVHLPTLATRAFPMPGVYDGLFPELCGSSTVGRIDPRSRDPLRLDPHEALGWHGDWLANAAVAGVTLARLPVAGAYLVGTGTSHSERDGPYADWRCRFSDAVAGGGRPLDMETARRFGLTPSLVAAARDRAPELEARAGIEPACKDLQSSA